MIVAVYDYTSETDELLFQAVRFEPKRFEHRRPDGHGGWLPGLGDVRLVLYRLPELQGKPEVVIADALRRCCSCGD